MNRPGKPRKKRILRRLILILLLLAILGGAVWYAWSALKLEYTVTYDSYTATTGSISNALSFSGNLALVNSAAYTAGSSSSVRNVYVAAGDEVKSGDKLVRLANGETATADFDGRVNVMSVEAGDDVTPGDALVQIADFTHQKVSFRVDEYDIGDVAVGQACTVTVTAIERSFESQIAAIDYISSSSGNVAYYTATAYVDVDDGVLPGMQVTVSIPQEEAHDVVVLKVDALSFDVTNQAYVWMKDESDEMKQVYVTTGVSNGNYIEIAEGLADGDEVYVEVQNTESSVASIFSSLFGSRQFNQPSGGMRSGSGMPGGGSMPEGFDPSSFSGSGSGGFSGFSGHSSGGSGSSGSGERPSMGGGGR